jgi:hypothetical protein
MDEQASAEYYPHGTFHRGPVASALWRTLALLAPYSEGGCCAPHWFDIHAEAVFLERDRASERVPFTSLGFPPPLSNDPPTIVLSSDDLDLGTEAGMRVTGTYQTGPGSNLEVTYLGLTHWSAAASVSRNADPRLWSPFSEFGTNPDGSPFFGYDEVDRADFHGISLETNTNTIEANYRRRWVGPTCLVQGSYLMGFRYFQLRETLQFNTVAPENVVFPDPTIPFMDYAVTAVNHLYGFQMGADAWVCLLPGLNVGGEIKSGIFGNNAEQKTTIVANSIPTALIEEASQTRASFVGEVDLMATYRVNHKFTIRAGYLLLYTEGVSLATENFNPAPPTPFSPVIEALPRVVSINTDGNALWYGWTLGAEYMW